MRKEKPKSKSGPRSMFSESLGVSAATIHRLSDHLFAQSPDFELVKKDQMQEAFPIDKNYDFNCWQEILDEVVRAFSRERPGTRPRAWWKFDAQVPHIIYEDGRVESQAHFLRRNDFLLPGELKRIKPEDFEPKVPVVEDEEDFCANDGCEVCGWAHVRAVLHGEKQHEV